MSSHSSAHSGDSSVESGSYGNTCEAPAHDAGVLTLDLTAAASIGLCGAAEAGALDVVACAGSDVAGMAAAPRKLPPVLLNQAEERSFVCEVCRKTFKRETNLMFHMATHRQQGADQQCWNAPVQCSACPKVFATKYQAKKHFLRRHFEGERRFACTRCNIKAFAVKEDLTTHMKTCGRTFACSCGARPRSLMALNKHCAQYGHTPAGGLNIRVNAPSPTTSSVDTPTQSPIVKEEATVVSPTVKVEEPQAGAAADPLKAELEDPMSMELADSFLASIDASGLFDLPMEGASDEDILAALSVLVN